MEPVSKTNVPVFQLWYLTSTIGSTHGNPDGNPDFHENGEIAKTTIIPKEYQWFWRVDGPQNAKITKFTKMLEFL